MMFKARIGIGILAILGMVALLVACAPAAAPTATPAPAPKAAATAPSAPATAAAPAAAPSAAAAKPTAPAAAPSAAAAAPTTNAGALQQLIDGARKEGVVRVNLSSDLGEKGAQRLVQALNKKYNLDLKMEYTPTANMPQVVAQVLTELKAGGSPSWDVNMGTALHFVNMNAAGFLDPLDWPGTFPYIPAQATLYNGGSLNIASSYQLPVYNPNLVKPEDVPRKYEDLVNPKWKGKLVVPSLADFWVWLTESWGEDRVTSLVEGLSRQDPNFGLIPQVLPKLTSGEYPLAAYGLSTMVFSAQEQGAPVRFAEEVRPVGGQDYFMVVPKKAAHPNAGKLFVGFQLTPEAQQIWWEETKYASRLVSGSPLLPRLQGKDLTFYTPEFVAKEGPRLTEKYTKGLGLK